ncbi:MAG: hypothetical protein GY805_08730 [Chloroflexi bacterium]|nr:hypothetical protein [Chloroflexota bacterium]
MNESGTNKQNGRFAITGFGFGLIGIIVYFGFLPSVDLTGFIILTTVAMILAVVSLYLGMEGRKLGERRLWVNLNLAVSIGFLVVLGILNTAVAYL